MLKCSRPLTSLPEAETIANEICKRKEVKEIDFFRCKLDDKLALPIIRSFRHSSFQKLHLSGNELGNEAAKALAQELCYNNTILAIYIWSNKISDEGMYALFCAIRDCNSTLRVFDISSCRGNPAWRGWIAKFKYLMSPEGIQKREAARVKPAKRKGDQQEMGNVPMEQVHCAKKRRRDESVGKIEAIQEIGTLEHHLKKCNVNSTEGGMLLTPIPIRKVERIQ
mmetsp:Transcript_40485/g.56252  ORF Transcript_40485/g.56252 Transcript_40485/m.56252 type:complete len:224 (-) Transcript_40485:189-860(-)